MLEWFERVGYSAESLAWNASSADAHLFKAEAGARSTARRGSCMPLTQDGARHGRQALTVAGRLL